MWRRRRRILGHSKCSVNSGYYYGKCLVTAAVAFSGKGEAADEGTMVTGVNSLGPVLKKRDVLKCKPFRTKKWIFSIWTYLENGVLRKIPPPKYRVAGCRTSGAAAD